MNRLLQIWQTIQEFLSVDGGLYVDLMCITIIVRLIAVLFHFPPLTGAEAGLWAATIGTYGASQFKGPRGS
jgi:hypothetical protein